MAAPTQASQRIASLDVLRGFALLGILLLNIIGFGLPSAAYSQPAAAIQSAADLWVWVGVDLFAEGAMRAFFSMLFGASVVLLATGEHAKSAGIFFRRNIWLLAFGLVDAYLLLWSGDILVTYALAGMLLYWVRHLSARRLLISAALLTLLLCAYHGVVGFGLGQAAEAAARLANLESGAPADPQLQAAAQQWTEFKADYEPTAAQLQAELSQRRADYPSAFVWNAEQASGMLLFVLPMFMFWDALCMMLFGMALYKFGVLQGKLSKAFYMHLAWMGLTVGVAVNAYEVYRAITNEFALLAVFAQMQPTYHIGRLGVALGYIGLLLWLLDQDWWRGLRQRLAAVGRMALTNYLMHSLLALFLFTGAGFALVGELTRWQLYVVVVLIWLVQLAISPWWLRRFPFGPLEWLWRRLTYGRWRVME